MEDLSNEDIHLLIVDDLDDNRVLLRLDLEDELPGISIDEADGGKSALAMLEKNQYSVVLCDLMMPEIDGFEVFSRAQEMGIRETPFIFVSANQDRNVHEKGLALGAIDFVTKPYDVIELVYKVKNLSRITYYYERQTELNERLEIMNRQLRASNQQKDEVLRIVSHDMRNPLGNMVGLAHLMNEEPDQTPEDIKAMSELMVRAGENLMQIVNTLLDAAKIEAGKISLDFEDVDVVELLCDESEQFNHTAQQKGIEIIACEETGKEHIVLKLDRSKTSQAIDNLISNAIKFSSEGDVIKLSTYEKDENIIIEISDTGIGMNEEQLKTIFEKFSAAHRKGTKNERGTGLGLSIVKSFVEFQNGSVEVESKEGEGSTFRIIFPTSN